MSELDATLSERPSALEAVLHRWLEDQPLRYSVEYAFPARTCVVDFFEHGRRAGEETVGAGEIPLGGAEADQDGVPAEVVSFAGLLERGAGHLAAARAAQVRQCREAAVLARELAGFAAARPAAVLDRPDGEVGAAAAASRAARPAVLTPVSEWAVDEVMVALRLSSAAASTLLAESIVLVEQLPGTLAALEDGRIGWAHARMLVEVLAPLAAGVRAEVEQRLLAGAAGQTVAQLRAAARRAVLRADAATAARRLAGAIRDRQVRVFPGEDGMASLWAALPIPVALACRDALERYAQACATPGDERSKDQRMVDCLVDLILRPGETGLDPVQVQLTVVAGVDTLRGGNEPGEIDGHPVPAEVVRELAYTLGLLPRPEPTAANPAPAGPVAAAPRTPGTTRETPAADTSTAEAIPVGPTAADVGAADLGAAHPSAAHPSAAHPSAAHPSSRDVSARDGSAAEAGTAEAGTAEPTPVGQNAPEPTPVGQNAPEPTPVGQGAAAARAEGTAEGTAAGTAAGTARAVSAEEAAAMRLAWLLGLSTVAGTALTHLPAIAVVEEISGQLLALTSGTALRAAATTGQGLRPPPDHAGYRPSDPLQRFVRARDRRCRFPGCRTPAIRCDLDHNTPWPAGATSADNLCCLCRHHHRLSHQAPGWTMRRLPGGGLEWTTPSGDRITTHPPRYGTDDHPPPNSDPPEPTTPPLTLTERVLGRPPGPDDDPAPF